jgi:hypothetical protein
MKIEIWNEEQKKEKQPLRLRLVPFENTGGGVMLQVVDKEGQKCDRGCLLHISETGQLVLHGSIKDNFGLKLDHGTLRIEK